jgi:L-rhamnose isomerase
MVRAWRAAQGLPEDPLGALAAGGYVERAAQQRASRNSGGTGTYA